MRPHPILSSLFVAALVVTGPGSSDLPGASAPTVATAEAGARDDSGQAGPPPSQAASNARVGFWRPSSFKDSSGFARALDAGQAKTVFDKLRQISDVFRETPVLKSAIGFEVQLKHSVDASVSVATAGAPSRLPTSVISVFLFDYIQPCATCPIKPVEESAAQIVLDINKLDAFFDKQPYESDKEAGMYLAPLRRGDLAGFPVYEIAGKGSKVLLTNDNTRPIWVAVSQERYIKAQIAKWQSTISKMKPPYDQNGRRTIAALESELTGLPASDRAAPSYVGGSPRSARSSGLGSASDRGARALVVANPEFFDVTRPKTSLQMAALRTYRPEVLLREPAYYIGKRLREAITTVDWKKIAGLLQ
jgi:hypothetical protein